MLSIPLIVLSVAGVVSATPLSTSTHYTSRERNPWAAAPLVEEHHPHGSLNNSYIVVFKQDIKPVHVENHMNFLQATHYANPLVGADDHGIRHVYDGHIRGYNGKFSSETVDAIRQMPEVAYVERDQIVHAYDVQKGAPWGLARISHRPRLGFSTFTKYVYNPKGGEGVDVYVIDTGINVDHDEFEGRAHWGKTMPDNDVDEDGNGHGTHCAGTIASRRYGVAKAAQVYAVKVLGSNGSGSMGDVVGGVVWAAQEAAAKMAAAKAEFAATGKTSHKGSVANMSLGGGKSRALDDAVNAAVDSGMHFAVAAGNDNRDACSFSPAAAEKAVTVGASTLSDDRAYFSNHGKCVDVFAPGLNILSTWIGSKNAVNTISGTSMASPHTAGMLAYLLSIYPSKEFNPSTLDLVDGLPIIEAQGSVVTIQNAYAVAHAYLPSWMTSFLPAPELFASQEATSTGPVTLTPVQLKRALLQLASPGLLSELPSGTPNLLIFNNATA
jgi:cerevisin